MWTCHRYYQHPPKAVFHNDRRYMGFELSEDFGLSGAGDLATILLPNTVV